MGSAGIAEAADHLKILLIKSVSNNGGSTKQFLMFVKWLNCQSFSGLMSNAEEARLVLIKAVVIVCDGEWIFSL